jgi:glucose/arabinose dehydrogenase
MRLFSFRFSYAASAIFAFASIFAVNSYANTFPEVTLSSLHDEFAEPWALTQLPTDEWLVTEKSGSIVKLDAKGGKQFYTSMPSQLYVAGQGGLMDIELHPSFDQTPWVYISYAEGNAAANRLAIARAEYKNEQLGEWQIVFRATPDKDTPVHCAARLAFDADGALLVTSGDGFDYREQAQVVESMLGKVLRMTDDGDPLSDNPFYTGKDKASDYVYTLGHRNAQGLVVDPQNGDVWLHEHGPAGGDEINLLQAGANYGWPVVTEGKDYSGAGLVSKLC